MDYTKIFQEISNKNKKVQAFIISKASTNNFQRKDRLSQIHAYTNSNDELPDNVVADLVSQLGLKVKNKDEGGGYVYILPEEDF